MIEEFQKMKRLLVNNVYYPKVIHFLRIKKIKKYFKRFYGNLMVKIILFILVFLIIFTGGFYAGRNYNGEISFNFWKNNHAKDNAYKAIVKIKTIAQNRQNDVAEASTGSGIVISPDGLILTNYHVVTVEDDFNDSRETGYTICLSEDTSKAPNCDYLAKLVERNKDLDLAILQIKTIPGLGQAKVFDYLDLNTADNTKIGDEITALGYPGIGEETITITQGIVSGKNEKYEKKWIKTDAVVSYGNSGGAAIDALGKVVGITSSAYADTLGSLGYVINVKSINQWLLDNKVKPAQDISFQDQLINLIKEQKELLTSDIYINNRPKFTLIRPSDWEFDHFTESVVYLDKKSDDEGGFLTVYSLKQPISVGLDDIVPFLKDDSMDGGDMFFPNIKEEKIIKVGGQQAKKISFYNQDGEVNAYIVPFENYFVLIYYDYGKDDKNKKEVDQVINSIKFENSNEKFTEVREYKNVDPNFELKLGSDWAVLGQNRKSVPMKVAYKKIKQAFYYARVEKADESNKDFTNQEYLDNLKKTVEEINKGGSDTDFNLEVTEYNPNVVMNKTVTGAMRYRSIQRSATTKKVQAQSVFYVKKVGDKYINIGFDLYSDNSVLYNQAQAELSKMLEGFALIN